MKRKKGKEQSFDPARLIPGHITRLEPYSSARKESEGSGTGAIYLDANELPEALQGMPPYINRYPGNETEELRSRIAAIKNIAGDRIFLGSGSDEIIDLLMRAFARSGKDEIMIFPPSFGMYQSRAEVNDLGVIKSDLGPGFMIDSKKALGETTENTRIIFVCSPNNPTGNLQPRGEIIRLLEGFNGLVVVDEAYIDFSPGSSLLPLLDEYPNLVVLQTFSKAFGMAGARVGMSFSSPEIRNTLDRIKLPYNLGIPSVKLAIQALNTYADHRLIVERIIKTREELSQKLALMPLVEKVYPSDANFLLVRTTNAASIYGHLAGRGVIVRRRDNEPGCEGCLRVSIGSDAENSRLIEVWQEYGKETGVVTGRESLSAPATQRQASFRRKTSETDITVRINLDGKAYSSISTGIGFFDHMLEQIPRHGMMDLEIFARGDLHVDAHHTIEDTGISLGKALVKALGDKKGIGRYGFSLPMDDSSASVLLDLGGRSYFKWEAEFSSGQAGGVPTGLYKHFFRSFAEAALCNLHITAEGEDDHHIVEAVFKAFARTLKMAVKQNESDTLPSTKGLL